MAEVNLDEKISSLTSALRIACDSPKDAGTLDQAAYYSKTNYAAGTSVKARLDAEAQQVQYLQSEVERLKGELTASKPNQILS